MVSWDIPGSHSVGDSGHTSDHNLITAALTQASELIPPVYNVLYYGADPTGSADSASAFEAVQTAIGTTPATVYIPAGNYKTSVLLSLVQNQNLLGDGAASVNIVYTGSTTALTIGPNGAFNDSNNAGVVRGISMSAYTASGSPVGIQFGELQGLQMDDVQLYGFAGKGLYGLNSTGWSEESNIRMSIVQCGTAVVFSGGSFDYGNYDFLIVSGPAQGGFTLEGDAQMQGCSLRIRGNFYIAATNTAAVIAIDPTDSAGESYMSNCLVDVAVENAPASGATPGFVSHYTLYMGSSSAASQFVNCTGVLSFADVATTTGDDIVQFQGYFNPNNVPVGFSGILHDAVLGEMQQGDGLAILGGTDYAVLNGTSDALFEHTIFFQFGDIQPFQLSSGTNTIVFDGIGNYAKQVILLIKQPSSGSAGTITWPSNVKWPGGTHTLSSTNSFIDKVRMDYIPADNIWYAEVVGLHYE